MNVYDRKLRNAVFRFYRAGHANVGDGNLPFQKHQIESLRHPMAASRVEIVENLPEVPNPNRRHVPRRYAVVPPYSLRELGAVDRRNLKADFNRYATRLFSLGIRFRTLLSAGGMGLVAIFEAENPQTGLFNKLVAKVALGSKQTGALRSEKRIMKLLKNSPHTVQIRTVNELRALPGGYATQRVHNFIPQAPPNPPRNKYRAGIDRANPVILMDYLPYGSLQDWIIRAHANMMHFDEETCWRMMLCLARGCVTLKYPPTQQPAGVPLEPTLAYLAAPGNTPPVNGHIVHFDIDPSNVLVDAEGFVAAGGAPAAAGGAGCNHMLAPVFKLTDFGLARTVDATKLRSTTAMWKMRTFGKTYFLAPEQWSGEWEIVKDLPSTAGTTVAGLYNDKTNVYQVGGVMMCVMLLSLPEDLTVPSQLIMEMVRVFNWTHPRYPSPPRRAKRDLTTRAWALDRDPTALQLYPWRLRELVMRCMAYNPAERPDPEELVDLIETRISEGFAAPPAPAAGVAVGTSAPAMFTNANKPVERQPRRAYYDNRGAV